MSELPLSFLCVGAQKAGTTTLHDVLSQVPEISLPTHKETRFFVDERTYELGPQYYMSQFNKPDGAIYGEIDPDCMITRESVNRIKSVCSDNLRIIFLLRDPIDRAYSQYKMNLSRGIDSFTSFPDAIITERERIASGEPWMRFHINYFERSLYRNQIIRFQEAFPKSAFSYFLFEDLVRDTQGVASKILAFIQYTGEVPIFDLKHSNKSTGTRLPFIQNALWRPSWVNSLGKMIIPSLAMRKGIKRTIMKLAKTSLAVDREFPPLDESIRAKYAVKFHEDLNFLRNELGLNLESWKTAKLLDD